MAKLSLYLKKTREGGEAPLYLKVSHDYRSALLLITRVRTGDWDADRQLYIGRTPGLRSRLDGILSRAEDTVASLRFSGELAGMTAADIAARIKFALFNEKPKQRRGDFLPELEAYRDGCDRAGTREVYDRTAKALAAFDGSLAIRTFEDIDRSYLERFERFCRRTMSTNTISIIMRNIRTVFNRAIDDGRTESYPFRLYKIKSEETRKRALTAEQLAWLINMEPGPGQEEARDIFLLSFYLIGINLADLLSAGRSAVINGYLNYRRAKTGRLYSVKVEPEAAAIIAKYQGSGHLVNMLERYTDEKSYRSHLNKRLKSFGRPTGKRGKIIGRGPYEGLSSYWARHTWATIAYEIGIPIDTIGQALGHSDRSHRVTFVYIKADQGKVDEANRRVIDYVLYGKDYRNEKPRL